MFKLGILCYKQGIMPIEIVGTFINGSLDGNCKIILENKSVIIGSYHQGLANGLGRIWDQDKNLVFAGLFKDGVKIGKCW